jgi:hypothetical protein
VKTVGALDELSCDPHPSPLLAHAALKDRAHVQLLGHGAQVLALALELEGRCPRRHPQLRNLGQRVEQFLGQASEKYSCSLSPLMLTKGSTAMDGVPGSAVSAGPLRPRLSHKAATTANTTASTPAGIRAFRRRRR